MNVCRISLWVGCSLRLLLSQPSHAQLQSWSYSVLRLIFVLGSFLPIMSVPFYQLIPPHLLSLRSVSDPPSAHVPGLPGEFPWYPFWWSNSTFLAFAILSYNSLFTYLSLPLDSSHCEEGICDLFTIWSSVSSIMAHTQWRTYLNEWLNR